MKISAATALVVALSGLSGCGKTITMVYHSNPEGATIIQNNRALGNAPVKVKYKAPPAFIHGGCASLSETAALWQSGAQAIEPQITACRANTYLQNVTFQRPAVPGIEVDVAAANNQQATRSAEQDANDAVWTDVASKLGGLIGTILGQRN